MQFETGPIVTNTGIMVFLGNFYEGQKKEISKCVPLDYMGLGWFVLEKSDNQYINIFYKILTTQINL